MANENVVVNITATSDFSNLITDVNRVSASLAKLQRDLITSDKAIGKNVQKLNADFANALTSSGQFSKYFVSLTSGAEKFGQSLDSGRLKLRDYFSTLRTHFTEQKSLISDLAKQQVQLQNALIQPLGKNAQGLMQYNIMVARGLDEVANKTKIAQTQAAIMNKVIQQGANQLINWGKNTQWAGRQLTVGLTVPIAAFGKAAADAFRLADKELVRLTKVYGDLGGATANELGKIRDEVVATAKDLSSSLGASFRETLALSADIAATGKTGTELLGSVRETTRLAVLGEVDRQEAMKATLAIQSAFKQNTEELSESINFLNAVENQTSTTLNDLVEAIPKAGPVIKGLGGSIQDLALYITAMREGGISASEGANALKSGLASLINPTDVAVDKFKTFGIDLLGMVQKNAGNTTALLLDMQTALDRLDPLQKQQAIEQLFGKFQFSRLNALFNNLGKEGSQTLKVLDLMKASTAELGAVADRELAMVTESASGRYARAIEKLKADLAGVGESFLGIATKIINVIDKFVNFVGGLPDPIKKVMGLAAGITAIAGPIIMLTGVLGNFFGYIIKGVSHFRALFKGAEGWKLLTPEILAANSAANQIEDSFYSDAKAADVLRNAIQNLINEYSILENKAQSGALSLSDIVKTTAGNPLIIGAREVIPGHPLAGAYQTRASSHMNPVAGMSTQEKAGQTFLGMVPSAIPVNRLIGPNPMIMSQGDLPRIEGFTSFTRSTAGGPVTTSAGVLAPEMAKWHAMTSALAMSSKVEIQDLKKSIALTGVATTDFMDKFDDILPAVSKITDNGARMSAAIVSELQAGKITVQTAREKIIALNFQIETMLADAVSDIAAARGLTVDLRTVPLTRQPATNITTGESNMRQMFRGENQKFLEGLGDVLGVRTSGAGYNVETTRPKRLNQGGYIYTANDGSIVPGPNVNADVVPAMLTPGEFVVNREATQANLPLLVAINGGIGSTGENKLIGGMARAASRARDVVRSVLGLKAKGPQASAFLQQIDTIQDPVLKARYLQAAKAYSDKLTRSKKDPKYYSPVAKTIQSKNIDALNDEFKAAGLAPLPYVPGTHATHLTVSKKLGQGKTLVSDYTVDYSADSNLAANRSSLRPIDFITRDLVQVGGLNKYERILRAAGIPREVWPSAERDIDLAIKNYFQNEAAKRGTSLAGLPNIGDRPESGAFYTFTKDIIPRIESVLPKYNDKALFLPSYKALKENKNLRTPSRRNRGGMINSYGGGGIIKGYNRGGMVGRYSSGGRVSGVQYKNAGGMIASLLLSQLGYTVGSSLGQKAGGGTGQMVGGSIGSILPFLLMNRPGVDINTKYEKSIFAGSKFGQSMLTQATSGSKLAGAMSKVGLALTRFNLAASATVVVAGGLVKVYKNHIESNKRLADSYGLTEERAKSLKLEYVDYIDVLRSSIKTMEGARTRNRLIFESMAAADSPVNLTIKQYKDLRKEIKQTMQTEIDMINNAKQSDLSDIAVRLKIQLMATGDSAEEANRKIAVLFSLTEYSEFAQKVTLANREFMNLKTATDVAVKAFKNFREATKERLPAETQLRAFNTALQATDNAIDQILAKNKKDGENQQERYKAELEILNQLKSKKLDEVEISNELKALLSAQDATLIGIIGRYETVVSLWQKIQIAAKGYTGNLKGLDPTAVNALYNLVAAVADETTRSTSAQGGLLFKEYRELTRLEKTRKDLIAATKGQTAAQEISSRKRIEFLQKEIEKINEAAEARQKALQEEQEDEDYLIQIQKKKIEYQDALAAGDMSRAAQAQLDIQSLTSQQQRTLASRAIEEKRQRDIAPLQSEIDRINKANQDLADKAALAADGIDKLNEKIQQLRDKIDMVNGALTDYRVAVLTGQSPEQRKEEAAAVLRALGIDPKSIDPEAFKDRKRAPGPTELRSASKSQKDIVATADEILNKIFGQKVDKVVMEAAEVYITESKSGTSKAPKTFTEEQLKRSGMGPGQRVTNQTLSALVKNEKLESGEIFEIRGIRYKVLNDYRNAFPTAEKLAMGGFVSGPGTPTSDSIPAMLSNGEYVINAKSVNKVGVPFLNAINGMKDGGPVYQGRGSVTDVKAVNDAVNKSGGLLNYLKDSAIFSGIGIGNALGLPEMGRTAQDMIRFGVGSPVGGLLALNIARLLGVETKSSYSDNLITALGLIPGVGKPLGLGAKGLLNSLKKKIPLGKNALRPEVKKSMDEITERLNENKLRINELEKNNPGFKEANEWADRWKASGRPKESFAGDPGYEAWLKHINNPEYSGWGNSYVRNIQSVEEKEKLLAAMIKHNKTAGEINALQDYIRWPLKGHLDAPAANQFGVGSISSQFSIPKGTITYRGLSDVDMKSILGLNIGESFIAPTVRSTTKDKNAAALIAAFGGTGGGGTKAIAKIIIDDAIKGIDDISEFGLFGGLSQEGLIAPGTKFVLEDIIKNSLKVTGNRRGVHATISESAEKSDIITEIVDEYILRATKKARGGYVTSPKFHNWNGTVPGPYNQEISATLKAGTEGVYQNNYISSLKEKAQGNTYINQPKIEVHAAPGMDEAMLADLVLKKFNQQNDKIAAAQGRSVVR